MTRDEDTDVNGQPFGPLLIGAVWKKGKTIKGCDTDTWRCDMYDKRIRFMDYGNTDSRYGWEIDHIKPVARDGSDDLSNLQPLQWENNRRKGDTYSQNGS